VPRIERGKDAEEGTPSDSGHTEEDLQGLKEQLSKKAKHPSVIPGSFYERDKDFKSKAYQERRAAVPPRHQGKCECVVLYLNMT